MTARGTVKEIGIEREGIWLIVLFNQIAVDMVRGLVHVLLTKVGVLGLILPTIDEGWFFTIPHVPPTPQKSFFDCFRRPGDAQRDREREKDRERRRREQDRIRQREDELRLTPAGNLILVRLCFNSFNFNLIRFHFSLSASRKRSSRN